MKIAIIGGGFTGLTAAYELAKRGHKVTVFEKDKTLGGLANGFRRPGWNWNLEYTYHHLFTNDTAILNLINELNLTDKLIIKRPVTATLWNGVSYPLDSPIHLLRFPGLPMIDRIRTGVLLAFLKVNPFWRPLESITAKQLFLTVGGRRAWEAIWEPLMTAKFGPYADRVAASWLWARIKKRTPRLCYIEGGFHRLIVALTTAIKQRGGTILTDVDISTVESGISNYESGSKKITNHNSKFIIHNSKFDSVLLTTPTPIVKHLCPMIPDSYFLIPNSIPHLHAQTLILETKQPILKDTYWLNITDRSFPFLAVVAHTNMIDKKHYGGHHLTYFGNYLPEGHPYLSMTKDQLLKKFLPFIKRLNPSFHWSDWSDLFIGYFAQPVHELHYSQKAPKLETGIPGVYLANLDSIYPWDRGTNYAVELGNKVAYKIDEDAKEPF